MLSVNVGRPRDVVRNGRPAKTAIWKASVPGRIAATGVNLDGDDQADRMAHGGPDKAIYAYASEDYTWWREHLAHPVDHAAFGENLTTAGIDVTGAVIGERWHIGSTLLEVSEPRVPCWRLNLRMDDSRFIKRFVAAGRPGGYLRIITEGDIGAQDAIEIVAVPAHGLTIGDVGRIYHHDRGEAHRLLEVDDLSDAWRGWARRAVDRHSGGKRTAGP